MTIVKIEYKKALMVGECRKDAPRHHHHHQLEQQQAPTIGLRILSEWAKDVACNRKLKSQRD